MRDKNLDIRHQYKSGSLQNVECEMVNDNSEIRSPHSVFEKGFTLIEIIVVIVILCIVSGITIKFLTDSLRIYTMTVNQKTLFDEGKLALERMCRDIRDARSITGTTATSITFTRNDATAQDGAGENIRFDLSGSTLRKVKNAGGAPENPIAMADNVSTFTVTNATNEIQLQLTLSLASGENVTLQTKVYPKNLQEDLTSTYKNFRILDSSGNPIAPTWEEVRSP
jgi:prepilin-type N-terminal cleavage/methylation domain-containing protein